MACQSCIIVYYFVLIVFMFICDNLIRRNSMENISIPLISPLSRKYYQYANDDSEKIHHRAEDVRICIEKVCDSIIIQLVKPDTKRKWKDYKLHNKIEACKEFMNPIIVDDLLNAKGIGNMGVHDGEEGNYSSQDIDKSLEAITTFSLEIVFSYFLINGFGNYQHNSWIPTVFSTLPPIYRVMILSKYYDANPSYFVIDKLSKAYLKSNMKEDAYAFLIKCYNNEQLQEFELERLKEDLKLLEPYLNKFSIARNLDDAEKNFLKLLPSIKEDERDSFVILVSMILTGKLPNEICPTH